MYSFPKYISDETNDKWVEIACPVLIFCMFAVIYLFPFLRAGDSLMLYLDSHSTMKILFSVVPSQILFLAGPIVAAIFAQSEVSLIRKLSLVNWKSFYITQAFKIEFILIIPLLAAAALSYFVLNYSGYDFSSSPIIELLAKADIKGIIVIFIFSAFIAPIVEEIAFRRVVFTFMARIFGSTPSIILSSLIFACMHGGFVQLIPLFILSLVLQHLYIKNSSLFPSILLHCFHNTIVMILFILGKISSLA